MRPSILTNLASLSIVYLLSATCACALAVCPPGIAAKSNSPAIPDSATTASPTGTSGCILPRVTSPPGPSQSIGRVAPAVNNLFLLGPYALLFQGISTIASIPGTSVQVHIAGSVTSDGQGNLTGEADLNSPYGVLEKAAITGTYSYTDYARGTMTLVTPLGSQTFSVSNNYAGGTAINTVPGGALAGSGMLAQQIRLDHFAITFVAQFSGETACDTVCTTAGGLAQPISGTGLMTLDPFTSQTYSTIFSEVVGSVAQVASSQSGTASPLDSDGRSVLTTTSSGSRMLGRCAVYYIDDYDAFFISLSPHDQFSLASGKVKLVP